MRWRCTRTNRMAEATLYWAARHGTRERNAQRRGVERRENTWSTGWVGSGLVGSAGPSQGLTPRPPSDRPPVRPDSTRPPEMCSTAELVAQIDGGVGALVLRLLRSRLQLLAPVGRLRPRL